MKLTNSSSVSGTAAKKPLRQSLAIAGLALAIPTAIWLFMPDTEPQKNSAANNINESSEVNDGDNDSYANAYPNSTTAPEPTLKVDDSDQLRSIRKKLTEEHSDPWALALFGLSGQNSFASVSAAAEQIFDRGNQQDINTLFQYLDTPLTAALNDNEWQAMHNRIVDYLVKEWPQHEQAEQRLLTLLQSADTQAPVKNAIVRRMDKMYEGSANPEVIEDTLWSTVATPKDDIASASLVALARINASTGQVDTDKLRDTATELVSSNSASLSTKVTAMEVATWLESPTVYTQAVDMIRSEKPLPDILQLTAISTILKLGDASMVEELEQLAETRPYPINQAAQVASRQLAGK